MEKKKTSKFRKPQQRKQGLKFLFYGAENSGKSVTALTFPQIAFVDTEAKVGVYENNTERAKNLVAVADTVEYYEVIELAEEVLNNVNDYSTFVTDSETNLYDSMKVAVMEVEEGKAVKRGGDIDDATIAMRGWGKVGLNNARYKNLKVALSSVGITVISIAHKKDVYAKDAKGEQTKVGEKPELKEGSKHDYDVVLRFYTTGMGNATKYYCEVEKDTTELFKVGSKIENPSYENWKEYIERTNSYETVGGNYAHAIEENKQDAEQSDEEHADIETVRKELQSLWNNAAENSPKLKEAYRKIFVANAPKGNPNLVKDVETLKNIVEQMKEQKGE